MSMEEVRMEALRKRRLLAALAAGGLLLTAIAGNAYLRGDSNGPPAPQGEQRPASTQETPASSEQKNTYPLHQNITATEFWVGEPGDADNGYIPNTSSAWVEDWSTRFGGVDNPDNPPKHPKENRFYFALPYNDLDGNGNQKPSARKISWYNGAPKSSGSILKNRWIEIHSKDGKVAYAQWEDVGPFGEDDFGYVFGNARPANATNDNAGLDLSPTATNYLGLNGQEAVDWRFVDASQVPDGPWKQLVTQG